MSESSAIVGREISDQDMSASEREIKRALIAFEENAKVADSKREQYRGKFVAVRNRQVIDNDSDIDRLLKRLDSKAKDPETYIGYIQKREEIFL